jgi:hypothetical protein
MISISDRSACIPLILSPFYSEPASLMWVVFKSDCMDFSLRVPVITESKWTAIKLVKHDRSPNQSTAMDFGGSFYFFKVLTLDKRGTSVYNSKRKKNLTKSIPVFWV